MSIYASSVDFGMKRVLIEWDGERPTDEEFKEYSKAHYGITGDLVVEECSEFRGLVIPGIAIITPVR